MSVGDRVYGSKWRKEALFIKHSLGVQGGLVWLFKVSGLCLLIGLMMICIRLREMSAWMRIIE